MSGLPITFLMRSFLTIRFACCNVVTRVYKTAKGDRYAGHCPKCAKPVSFRIGPGGHGGRAFIVG